MSLLPSQTARHEAMMEFSALGQPGHLPLGMMVWPTEIFKWSGILSIHQGYYSGSILHFTLTIPSTYPSNPPIVTFDSPVFHPLIDPSSGRMKLDTRFKQWRPRMDFIWMVLHFVKASFKRKMLDEIRESNCANLEAYRLYRDQTSLFAKLASQSSTLSHSPSILYSQPPPTRTIEPNPTPFRFRRLEQGEKEEIWKEVEEMARKKIVKMSRSTVELG